MEFKITPMLPLLSIENFEIKAVQMLLNPDVDHKIKSEIDWCVPKTENIATETMYVVKPEIMEEDKEVNVKTAVYDNTDQSNLIELGSIELMESKRKQKPNNTSEFKNISGIKRSLEFRVTSEPNKNTSEINNNSESKNSQLINTSEFEWNWQGTNYSLCLVCQNVFTKRGLEAHMIRAHTALCFPCLECDRVFHTKEKYERHMFSHKHLNCDRTFQLRPRIKSQTKNCLSCPICEPKEKKCEFCNKIFRNKRSLNIHIRTHIDKPYKCHCGGNFNTQKQLDKHIEKIHILCEEVKKIQCTECDKSYMNKHSLNIHLKRKHPVQNCLFVPTQDDFLDVVGSENYKVVKILKLHEM